MDGRDKSGHDAEGKAMARKIVAGIIVVPLAIVIVVFAVANRQTVTVSFDPFSAASPAYAAHLPLFVLIFIILIFGVIIGGAAAWLRQGPWRRTARKLDADVQALHAELEAIRRQFGTQAPAQPPPPPSFPHLPPSDS